MRARRGKADRRGKDGKHCYAFCAWRSWGAAVLRPYKGIHVLAAGVVAAIRGLPFLFVAAFFRWRLEASGEDFFNRGA
jgi:hypothetical protein